MGEACPERKNIRLAANFRKRHLGPVRTNQRIEESGRALQEDASLTEGKWWRNRLGADRLRIQACSERFCLKNSPKYSTSGRRRTSHQILFSPLSLSKILSVETTIPSRLLASAATPASK